MMEKIKEMLVGQSGVAHLIVTWYNHPIILCAGNAPTFGQLEQFTNVVNLCAAAGLESAPPRGVRAEVREGAADGILFRLVGEEKTSDWAVLPDSGEWVNTVNANIAQFNAM